MTDSTGRSIEQLAADLGSKNAPERMAARKGLVRMGTAAVPALLAALADPRQHVRWESAKALTEIADPSAAEGLVAAMGDKDSDVRWVVGVALIALGRDAVKPLLTTLTKSDLPDGVPQVAHHVLHDLGQRDDLASLLQPVIRAFEESEPNISVPLAAAEALQSQQV
jgi:HEAT repeat protein